jgi:hypothetical protein
MIKCFYLLHVVIPSTFAMFLWYDYFKISMYNPISMEDKLLMEYDFIPDPEFPDKN